MHPLVAYELAKLRIEESHREADRERRLRVAADGTIVTPDVPGLVSARKPVRTFRARLGGAFILGALC